MRLRVCVYVCTSDEFGAEEKQWVSRSHTVSVEKSESEYRDETEQNKDSEKEKCIEN